MHSSTFYPCCCVTVNIVGIYSTKAGGVNAELQSTSTGENVTFDGIRHQEAEKQQESFTLV